VLSVGLPKVVSVRTRSATGVEVDLTVLKRQRFVSTFEQDLHTNKSEISCTTNES